MLDHALQYASRNWRVFPVHTTLSGQCSCGRACGKEAGKHPRIKAWQKAATTDRAQIERWWSKWPSSNIGIATGGGIVVTDLDGAAEIARMADIAAPHGGLPETLTAATARGYHVYLAGDWHTTRKVPDSKGLLVRGVGGYVIAPPSLHASGIRYSWARNVGLAPMPEWFRGWLQSSENPNVTLSIDATTLQQLPAYIRDKAKQNQGVIGKRIETALGTVPQTAHEIERIRSALAAIPANCGRDPWLHVGMGLHALHWDSPDGTDMGFELWREWSETGGDKFQGLHDLETRWTSFGRSGREGVTLGTLFHLAEQHGWGGLAPRAAPDEEKPPASDQGPTHSFFETDITSAAGGHGRLLGESAAQASTRVNGHSVLLPPQLSSPSSESPLIMLNDKYACIGDIGGKCLVLGWVPSKIDAAIDTPSFQTFKSFAERFSHKYVMVSKGKGEEKTEEPAQLGSTWLKWRQRKSFEGIDLVPGADGILPGNVLNLWRGFAVQPAPGNWERMKQHIAEVLADNNAECLDYIVRWAAWSAQNPGERAEVALVFKGEKGAGKGTFAHAMRRMFGQHGLHISNSKHLVGAFNAHLRNCLLLYADEAFWAGDKQGESVLKALITEPVQMIEQKGIDAAQWRNRIHLIMTANADWVVPASHDERRYAVFNVSSSRIKDEKYFALLHKEMSEGGLAAMLHDLLKVDLGSWHPRRIPHTEALREQKQRSMNSLQEWWENLLQEGIIPAGLKDAPDVAYAQYLVQHAREFAPRLRDLTPAAMGRFLAGQGCVKLHRSNGNAWRFPLLLEARGRWEKYYSGWKWERAAGEWVPRS